MKIVRDKSSEHPNIPDRSTAWKESIKRQHFSFVAFMRSSPLVDATIVIARSDSLIRMARTYDFR